MLKQNKTNKPAFRKLRGYAFDPSLSLTLDTAQVNNLTYKVDWEELEVNPAEKTKSIPVGEYLEIIDFDPASGLFYPPVDLNDKYLLAQDGLNPSVSDPQFHQQMVYAVIMNTIKNFERALGRKIQWSSRYVSTGTNTKKIARADFVQRLRVYPHALRQANAYYHPFKKAILFGYFQAQPANPRLHLPGGTVFTCLSHDIIAHETTHAILDGLHRRYIEDTHPDTRAFHEAFADIVALFQHFTFPEVLKNQIAKTRGNLASQNMLGELAIEFGKAMGNYGGLRDAIGHRDEETGTWVPHEPDPTEYATKMEFHDRGAILVAAVFDAFLQIYKKRIKSLLRVATGGSGILPEGDLHPDMVNLLAETAAETASRVLRICVRAIDYCPPLDINFGDYLRALITADVDMVSDDERGYRIAFIEAFQKRGIFPTDVKTMSVETLTYESYPEFKEGKDSNTVFEEFLRKFKESIGYENNREKIFNQTRAFIGGSTEIGAGLHRHFNKKFIRPGLEKGFADLAGLRLLRSEQKSKAAGFDFSKYSKSTAYQIENLWLGSRVTPDDKLVNHVIVTLLQKRGVLLEPNESGKFKIKGFSPPSHFPVGSNGFVFRGGCTLIFDLDTMRLKYAIKKDINDIMRLEEQYKYQNGLTDPELASTYFNDKTLSALSGPFAFMHSYISHP